VPWQSVDALYQQELQTTADRIREYECNACDAGTWQPEYEQWVQMLAGLYRGPGRELVADVDYEESVTSRIQPCPIVASRHPRLGRFAPEK
jgi:hypothetical protein